MSSTIDLIKDLFTGCCSGWGQVVTMMPFENIKVKNYINLLGKSRITS
jgi:hypothetical protein